MARYWVGDAGEPDTAAPDPSAAPAAPAVPEPRAPERERPIDAVRRTLIGTAAADDPADG